MRRRGWVTALTAVLALAVTAPAHVAQAGPFTSNGPCASNASVEPNNHLKQITGSIGDGCNPNSSPFNGVPWVSNPPPDGTDCSHEEWVPGTVTLSSDRKTVTITGIDPQTGQQFTGQVSASEIGTTFSMPGQGQQEIFQFPFQGTFQHGVCTGSYVMDHCPHLVQINSGPWPFPACMSPQPIPVGGMLPPGVIQTVGFDIQAQLTQLYTLGAPQSLPAVRGLVNVPACFWLVGDNAPLDQYLQLVLIGPGAGPSPFLIYTLVIHVSAPGVDWHFDDPTDPNDTQVGVPSPCTGTPATVAHSFRARSDGGHQPDGTFHVTATQTYSISATLYWIDFFGASSMQVPLTPAQSTLTLTSQPYHYPVIQEEGVPIGQPGR